MLLYGLSVFKKVSLSRGTRYLDTLARVKRECRLTFPFRQNVKLIFRFRMIVIGATHNAQELEVIVGVCEC